MNENKIEGLPFSLVFIAVFYGLLAFLNVLGATDQYILFSIILPPFLSKLFIAVETTVLLFITVGVYKRQAVARSLLIGYNIFAITDILFTFAVIDKEKLLGIIKNEASMEYYVQVNLYFSLALFLIMRFVNSRKSYFNNRRIGLF